MNCQEKSLHFFLGKTAFKGGKNYFEMDFSSNCVCME